MGITNIKFIFKQLNFRIPKQNFLFGEQMQIAGRKVTTFVCSDLESIQDSASFRFCVFELIEVLSDRFKLQKPISDSAVHCNY